MKKISHIWFAIVGLPILIAISPLIPQIYNHMMWVVIGVGLFFGLWSLLVRAYADVVIALVVAGAFFISQTLFSSGDERYLALQTAAVTSFTFLNVVLWIGPWSRFVPRVRTWYRHRRHLGVVTFFLALLHFSLVLGYIFNYSLRATYSALFTLFGFTGLFLLFFLALTSFDWQQKHVGNTRWKWIHLGMFILYLVGFVTALFNARAQGAKVESYQWLVFAAFFLFWVIVAPWGLAPKIVKYMKGWKQLHVLIHLGFFALVLHVWMAFIVSGASWLKLAFIIIVAFTWGSHLVGWLIKWQQDRELKKRASQSRPITIEGKEYWSVGQVNEFQEGKGKKFLIKNLPIAVFRYQEKFFGLFAVCPHQKGPMEKGKIVNGYVECPWHGWQYSCETGMGPPGFHDRVAFYPCVVQEGVVYVSAYPKRADSSH